MKKLLHVECSPRKERSHSILVAKEFIKAYTAANPEDDVEVLDLWSMALPEFDGFSISAKYKVLHGLDLSDDEQAAWDEVKAVFARFNSADKYLFSVPMWNFSIPYKLKHLIDIITQPGLAFSFSPDKGYEGLVSGKPAMVIYASGGDYTGDMKAYDQMKPYIEQWLGFIGFSDITSILVQPTMGPEESTNEIHQKAIASAKELAAEF